MRSRNRNGVNFDEVPKAEIKKLRLISSYLSSYKLSIVGILVALILASLCVLSLGYGLRYLVDSGFSASDSSVLDKAFAGLMVIVFTLAVATYMRFYLVTKIGEQVIADIRIDIYNRLISLSPSFYEVNNIGAIMSRMTADATVLQVVIGSSLSIAMRNILLLCGGLALMIITSPSLSAYIAIMIPLIVLPVVFLGKKVRRLSHFAQDKVADLSGNIEEALSGIKTIQAFTRENIECKRFSNNVQNTFDSAMARVRVRAILVAAVILIAFSSIGVILWIGGKSVIAGEITAGELSSFVFYSILVASSFGALSQVIGDIQRAAGAAEGLAGLLQLEPDIKEVENPVKLREKVKGAIQFEKVKFAYPTRQENPAIKNFNLHIEPGEVVALVGPSGAGKSTLIQLLLRFYDPVGGKIRIDGVNIKQMKLADLRNQFAYVAQDPVVFSTSVKENIAYGKEGAIENEIIEAAKVAQAYDFIKNLPDGFDTHLGEKGVRLSGGERQRVAIARAALRNPLVLLLDEATSALDSENEKLVQDALSNLMKGRSTIVIAHRLSTVLEADRIVVMDKGQVKAIGTHKELIKQDKLYQKLVKLQLGV